MTVLDTSVLGIFKSVCFWSPFLAWMLAQSTKMLNQFTCTRRFDFNYLISTGGMPSAHSAMVSGLATSVGLMMGFTSPAFDVALAFALLVMFDAATVRRAAGAQARVLNKMMDELFKEHRLHESRLAELLGHTRLEVFAGMVIGVLMALLITSIPLLRQ
jgi:acid phosphatase family membrane protein YuiD